MGTKNKKFFDAFKFQEKIQMKGGKKRWEV